MVDPKLIHKLYKSLSRIKMTQSLVQDAILREKLDQDLRDVRQTLLAVERQLMDVEFLE